MNTENPLGERMARLEEKTDNIDRIVGEINTKLDNFIETAPKKFSAKWVEKSLAWGITFVVGSVLTALLAIVLK